MGFSGGDVKILDFSFRLFVIPFNIASIWIAVSTQEDNTDYGKLEFNNLISLKYMVCVTAISTGYVLFAAISSHLRCLQAKAWLFFVTDQVLANLMMTSIAALGEFFYLLDNGDRAVTWSRACGSYGHFCSRLEIVLALHTISVCCFVVLAVISAYRIFRRFEAPLIYCEGSDQERT